ncbi:hypothetical protein [Phocaeicola vulgatus]|uniref:Uncharacterized protein n=1 Tax=Phocaeicola vulgatus TaxID=821 RepID=A0A848QZU2_PHOVU|nr:hypothetical protein [Phocaeicola vulgatus]NMW41647.1 hypothetical protein [Phocaeicola vulgatus]
MGDKILPTSEYDTFLILSDKIRQEATDLEALFYRDCHPPILRVSLSYTETPPSQKMSWIGFLLVGENSERKNIDVEISVQNQTFHSLMPKSFGRDAER